MQPHELMLLDGRCGGLCLELCWHGCITVKLGGLKVVGDILEIIAVS